MRKIQARIHSLDGQFDEVTIISEKSDNDIIVDYNGVRCTAIYNVFVGSLPRGGSNRQRSNRGS